MNLFQLSKPKMKRRKECGGCKHFEQGENSSFCGNPKQTNEAYKKYVYWNYDCELYEEGIAKSRILYMRKLAEKV